MRGMIPTASEHYPGFIGLWDSIESIERKVTLTIQHLTTRTAHTANSGRASSFSKRLAIHSLLHA
jgi:hypothetical protein